MSVKTLTCEIYVCDGCQEMLGESGDYIPHFGNETAQCSDSDLNLYDWREKDGKHFCDNCALKHGAECGECFEWHLLANVTEADNSTGYRCEPSCEESP